MNGARRIRTIVAATTIALTFGTGLVRAETTGDLYVASTAGILEVVTSSGSVPDSVPVTPSPVSIAIRPDGRELFALTGGRKVVGIDLESMAIASRLTLPVPGAAIAYPRGEQLVIAMPSVRRLAVSEAGTGTLSQSESLPGPVDLLSADRRDGRVLAAAKGGHWVAVFDPGTGSIRSTTVSGSVAAIGLDPLAGTLVVATTHPNRVVALDVRDFATRWTMTLSGAPQAISVAGITTLVAAGKSVWALDHATAPGVSALGVSTAGSGGRRWASLAGPATALVVSDDGSLLYALEEDRVEGFAVERPAGSGTSAPAAVRSVRLAGTRAPVAIVAVPGAQPLLGGPGVHAATPVTPGSAAAPRPSPVGGVAPRTDTILDAATGIPAGLPGAVLTGLVILALGLLGVRRYERGYREPATATSTVRPARPGSPPRR